MGILKRDSKDKINFQERILVIKKKRIFNVSSNRIEFLRYLRIVNVYQKFEYDDLRKNMTRYMSII